MEITRSNFREKLPEITSDINRSVFIAFDQEFTGLSNAETRNPYATLEEVYSNKLRTAEGFIVIQFGLTCFFFDDPAGGTGDRLSYKSYNFYVSPRRRRSVFLCESDAMSFLSRNNFDFNKLFREGISFCTIPEEETLREQLKERQSKRAEVMVSGEADTGNHILVPEKEEPLVQGIIEQIEEYLQGPAENELQLKGLNGFQRRLIYQTIETKFFQKVTAVTDQNVMLVKKMASPEDVKREEEERCVKEAADLEDQVGMTMLMKVLSDSRKLIVGHNIYHDLFYLVRQFFRPLPEDYSGFKSLLHELFPFLLDTKYLCCTHDQLKELIPSSVLGDVFRDIRKEPFDLPEFVPAGSEYGYAFEDDDKAHEAGWDALICGICFVGMARKLGVGLESPLEKNALLKPFINRIFVMGVSDVKCINLGGKDPAPKRDHVFHVTFPATWKRIDITNRFKDFGGCQVYRLSDTTAFIGLIQPEFSSAVWKSLKSSPEMKIQRYLEYTKPSLDVGQDSPLTTVVKRKLADSSSPMDGSKKTKSNKSPNFPTNDNWTK